MSDQPVLVAFDMNYRERKKEGYFVFDTTETIQYLCCRIREICEELQKMHPNDPWMITWPENGIHYISAIASFTNAEKNEMKKQLSELCWQYPQLTLVAGTTLSVKNTSIIKAKELLAYYEMHPWLKDDEEFKKHKTNTQDLMKNPYNKKALKILRNTCFIFTSAKIFLMKSPPLSFELEKYAGSYLFTKEPLALVYVDKNAQAAILQIQDKTGLETLLTEAKLDKDIPLQLRNCDEKLQNQLVNYIKESGREHIARIDKISPFDELETFPDTFFKIGGKKGRNMEHMVNDMGIEICLEHRSGVAKHEVEELKVTKPKLQIVISSSTTPDFQNVVADYVLHVDSLVHPCLYKMQNSPDQYTFYIHNFVSDNAKNLTKMPAMYPFVSFYLSEIEKMKSQTKDEELILHLDRYKDAILGFSPLEMLLSAENDESYNEFKKLLNGMYSDEKCEPFKKTIKKIYSTLKSMHQFEKEHMTNDPSEEEKEMPAGQTLFSQSTMPTSPDPTPTSKKHQQG